MKSKEELLKFYGVEKGKQYKVTKSNFEDISVGDTFTIYEKWVINSYDTGSLMIEFKSTEDYCVCYTPITRLNDIDYEEYENLEVLNDEEKKLIKELLQVHLLKDYDFENVTIKVEVNPVSERLTMFIGEEFETIVIPYINGNLFNKMKKGKKYRLEEIL